MRVENVVYVLACRDFLWTDIILVPYVHFSISTDSGFMFRSTLERERERGRLISGGWTAQTKLNAVTANYSSEIAMETTGHSCSYIRTANAQATLIFIACDLVWWR